MEILFRILICLISSLLILFYISVAIKISRFFHEDGHRWTISIVSGVIWPILFIRSFFKG